MSISSNTPTNLKKERKKTNSAHNFKSRKKILSAGQKIIVTTDD